MKSKAGLRNQLKSKAEAMQAVDAFKKDLADITARLKNIEDKVSSISDFMCLVGS
jgi:hypothetical protein